MVGCVLKLKMGEDLILKRGCTATKAINNHHQGISKKVDSTTQKDNHVANQTNIVKFEFSFFKCQIKELWRKELTGVSYLEFF